MPSSGLDPAEQLTSSSNPALHQNGTHKEGRKDKPKARRPIPPQKYVIPDRVTTAFILVWASLCIAMLFRRWQMWRVGAGFLVFQTLSWLSERCSVKTFPQLRKLEASKLDLWHNTLVSYLHSITTSAGVGLVLWLHNDTFGRGMYLAHSPSAYTVVCISCGYFAYDLWDMVQRRLYNPHSPSILWHHAVLLVCFTIALYRNVTINYLILTLACEVNSVFLHQRRLLSLIGVPASSSLSKLNWVANWLSFGVTRSLPHGLLPILLIADYHSFPTGIEWPLAMVGMFLLNVLNFELFKDLRKAYVKERSASLPTEGLAHGPHED